MYKKPFVLNSGIVCDTKEWINDLWTKIRLGVASFNAQHVVQILYFLFLCVCPVLVSQMYNMEKLVAYMWHGSFAFQKEYIKMVS